MNLEMRILQPFHRDAVLTFARTHLPSDVDEMEREMLSWGARWRREALDHYLPQGWCFAAFDGEGIAGVILAQPYLFHRGFAQTLWIEEVLAPSVEVAHLLVETVHKWARDKHFQCVLAENRKEYFGVLLGFPRARTLGETLVEIPSAKY